MSASGLYFADRNRAGLYSLQWRVISAYSSQAADGMSAGASDRYDRYGEHSLHNRLADQLKTCVTAGICNPRAATSVATQEYPDRRG